MINKKESKQPRTDSQLLKVLSRDMKAKAKTKNEDLPKNIHKKIPKKIKNIRKMKTTENKTPTMDHCSRNGQIEDNNP